MDRLLGEVGSDMLGSGGTLVGEKLVNAVSAGNDGRRLLTETQ
jgi:hypothetical protein